MNYKELLKLLNGVLLNIPKKGKENIRHFQIDSRLIREGDCFIAIMGNNQDGHDFIEDAVSRKASCIIVEKDIAIKSNAAIIKVAATLDSLIQLGHYYREKYRKIPLIAITGSVGKTSTKELISEVLMTEYRVLKSTGNHNNHIGVPLTLFELNKRYEVAVLELGMNHFKEIDRLSQMCLPDIAVITNIGTAHIGNLGSQKNIWKAKMEITNGMEAGTLLVNGDDRYLKKVKNTSSYHVISCGKKKNNQFRVFRVKESENGISFDIKVEHQIHSIHLPIGQRGYLYNALLAIQIGLLFSVPIEKIIAVIEQYSPKEQRMHSYFLKNKTVLIDDCYNASYESVRDSLRSLRRKKQRKLIILGDILELGDFSDSIHKKIGRILKYFPNREVLLYGEATNVIEGRQIRHFATKKEMIAYLDSKEWSNTCIFIKGSRKMGLEEIRDYFLEKNNK